MVELNILLGVIGGPQVIIIVVIVLLLFGGRKIPELMRGIGRGVKEFKDGMNGDLPNETPSDKSKDETDILKK